MRVLQVIEATIGGTRRHIVDVAGGLARAGIEVWLVSSTLRDANYLADLERLRALGVRTLEIPMLRAVRPWTDLRHQRQIERALRRIRPDIVHSHCSKAGTLARLAVLSTGIGVPIHTPHTLPFLLRNMFGPARRALFWHIERGLFERTKRLIAVSPAEAESFRRAGFGDPARLRVVENGIDTGRWTDAQATSRATLGVPPAAKLAVVAGLLNSAKGQDIAIRALARPELCDTHLVLAGHGEMEAQLRALAREHGVESRVHLLGWRDDVPNLFHASDVVLVPSRWEAMPYALLEALAAGKPAIASKVDGAKDLLVDGAGGLLVEIEDVAGLARAWAQLNHAPPALLARMAESGRRRVLGRYTVEAMVEKLLEVYREAV